MNPELLTQSVTDAISEAQTVAVNRKQQNIGVSHLFKILIQPGQLDRQIFSDLGVDLDALNAELDHEMDSISTVAGESVQYGQNLSPDMYRLLQKADEVRQTLNDEFIASDTLIIAVVQMTGSRLGDWLQRQGFTVQQVKNKVTEIRGGERITTKNQEEGFQALDKYGTELVKAMRSGERDPIIGRDDEILSITRILSRKTKNNPVLIGEPGVGKTAIVEALPNGLLAATCRKT